jgi:Tol biopolymer transport system component
MYVIRGDGSGLRRLTNFGSAEYPAWSQDGTRLSFAGSVGRAAPQLYVIGADGRGTRRLTRVAGAVSVSAWSPVGTKIAFLVVRPKGPTTLNVINADGTGLRRLSVMGHADPLIFSWSPDGKLLAFPDSKPVKGLYIVTIDGGKPRIVVKGAFASVGWLHSGSSLLVGTSVAPSVATPAHPHGIVPMIETIRLGGHGLKRLATGDFPAVSPDEQRIAYYSQEGAITTMRADGTTRKKIATFQTVGGSPLEWSPDGSKLAFVTITPPNYLAALNIIDSGSGQRLATEKAKVIAGFAWQPPS